MREIRWVESDPSPAFPSIRWQDFCRERGLVAPLPEGPVAAYMALPALAAASDHGRSSPAAEVGGILCGRVYKAEDLDDLTLVDIVAALPAHAADGTPAHLTFTPEAWDHVFAQRAELPGDLEIVGWYHTHPGLGVFLSGTDLRTQAAFFGQPWSLALVLDPCNGDQGAFLGPQGRPAALVTYFPSAIAEGGAEPASLQASGRIFGRFFRPGPGHETPSVVGWIAIATVAIAAGALALAVKAWAGDRRSSKGDPRA